MDQFLKYMDIKQEVREALEAGRGVVALESTIISHGMPYPENVQMAKRVEEIIRAEGSVPATIAVIKGRIKIGLEDEDLEFLATSKDVLKISRRDMATVVAQGLNGATTVATTMIGAAMAGIKVFVTGGIGGVHRGASESFDISADLQELAKTDVAVVCAGAKSILDLGLTLEYLETNGVPVLGVETGDFPAFYTRSSGFKVDYKVDSIKDMAKIINTKWELGLRGGVVVANPIPREAELDNEMINTAIENALLEAEQKAIKGKEVTPFLLAKLKDITEGKSLEANLALVYNNAKVGGRLAAQIQATT